MSTSTITEAVQAIPRVRMEVWIWARIRDRVWTVVEGRSLTKVIVSLVADGDGDAIIKALINNGVYHIYVQKS